MVVFSHNKMLGKNFNDFFYIQKQKLNKINKNNFLNSKFNYKDNFYKIASKKNKKLIILIISQVFVFSVILAREKRVSHVYVACILVTFAPIFNGRRISTFYTYAATPYHNFSASDFP